MENYGFPVLDLGRDVPAQKVVAAVKEHSIKLVGLSALMTTTLKSMEETIAALRAENLDCKVMVGGAVLTEDYAMKIGADFMPKMQSSRSILPKGTGINTILCDKKKDLEGFPAKSAFLCEWKNPFLQNFVKNYTN